MKTLGGLQLISSLALSLLVMGCAWPEFNGFDSKLEGTFGGPSVGGQPPDTEKNFTGDPELQEAALNILDIQCASCHGAANMGGVTNILDVNHLVNTGLIIPGDDMAGGVIQSIEDGSMPVAGPLAIEEIQAIKVWALTIVEVEEPVINPPLPPVTPPPPMVLEPTFASINALIIEPKCLGCHNSTNNPKKVDYSSYEATIATGGVVAGNPMASDFYREVLRGKMPRKPLDPLSSEEIEVISMWIELGALNN